MPSGDSDVPDNWPRNGFEFDAWVELFKAVLSGTSHPIDMLAMRADEALVEWRKRHEECRRFR